MSAFPALVVVIAVAGLIRPDSARAQVIDTYLPPLGVAYGASGADQVRAHDLDEYAPYGIHLGTARIDGELSASGGYDSNADAVPNGHASAVFIDAGSASIASNWSRNELHAGLTFIDVHYPNRTVQDQTSWTANVGGVYDLGRDKLGVSYSHLDLYQISTDIGALLSIRPVHYAVDTAGISYSSALHNRLTLIPELLVTQYRFDSGNAGIGTQAYRNRTLLTGSVAGRYEMAPGETLVVVVQGTDISYQQRLAGLPGRDSLGGAVMAGIDFGLSGPIRLRALAGYQRRSYRSNVYGNLDSPIAQLDLSWLPTRLTTVSLSVRNGIEDSGFENVGGFTYTSARLSLLHTYLRNLTFGAYTQIQNASYSSTPVELQNTPLNQQQSNQTIYGVGLNMKWLLNRSLSLTANYDFSTQNSVLTDSLTTNEFLVGLHFAF